MLQNTNAKVLEAVSKKALLIEVAVNGITLDISSPITLTKFCLLLTTYLPQIENGEGIHLLLFRKICIFLTFLAPPYRECVRNLDLRVRLQSVLWVFKISGCT